MGKKLTPAHFFVGIQARKAVCNIGKWHFTNYHIIDLTENGLRLTGNCPLCEAAIYVHQKDNVLIYENVNWDCPACRAYAHFWHPIVLAMFVIPISLILIVFSRFFKRKLRELFQRFGYEPVIYSMMNNNFRGLFDLLYLDHNG